ncbi:MAG TPA: hypothetical protein VGH27_02425 [Streptosporangiaceae bacterium]
MVIVATSGPAVTDRGTCPCRCGACYSSCGVAAAGRDFLGPAALNRALVLVADSRDGAAAQRLARAAAADGTDRCHYIYACTAAYRKLGL